MSKGNCFYRFPFLLSNRTSCAMNCATTNRAWLFSRDCVCSRIACLREVNNILPTQSTAKPLPFDRKKCYDWNSFVVTITSLFPLASCATKRANRAKLRSAHPLSTSGRCQGYNYRMSKNGGGLEILPKGRGTFGEE